MGMDLAMAGINHQPFIVRIINQYLQKFLPHPLVAPTDEATMRVTPTPIVRWQITPRSTCTHNPEYRIDKKTIIVGDAAPTPLATWKMGLKKRPNSVTNIVPTVRCYAHNHAFHEQKAPQSHKFINNS